MASNPFVDLKKELRLSEIPWYPRRVLLCNEIFNVSQEITKSRGS